MIGQTAIDEHLLKAQRLSDSEAWFEAHNSSVKKIILNLIRESQLRSKGIDENEKIIGLYSRATEIISNGRKKAGDPFTLYDTGQFYRSMFIVVLKDSILIDADYTKMQDQDWWSINILGLTEKNLDIYAEMVRQNYIKYARRILGIN
jgi:hypothetical protein|tara:strand:- start:822 stop:1265 length:444 start_codon:yes stop_codon:yes gene_type:complete